MKIFKKNRNTFIFNYSIHLVFFFCLLLCPSFPRCRFFRFLLDSDLCYNPVSSSCFVVNAQQQNLFLQIVAGNGTNGYNGDNRPATTTQLNLGSSGGVYEDSNGVLYVGDLDNYRLRKIDFQGIITTVAGTGTLGTSGASGAGTSISIGYPRYIAADTMGSYLYFSDNYYVWKYQISNGILSRYAGVAPLSQGSSGDGQQASAARFYANVGISLSTLGLLYISDHGNNRVRVVAVNGIVTTFAGSGPDGPAAGSYGGDGGSAVSSSCKLYGPFGVYVDTVGSVFIADLYNARVRKVDTFGIIRTFAGGGSGGDGGQGSSAVLSNVYDVKGDRLGNMYITGGCAVRIVNTAGIINTIIGSGTCGITLTFLVSASSPISSVYGLWVNSNFEVYIAESAGIVRKTVDLSPTSQPSSHPSSSYNVEHQNLFLEVVAGNGTNGYNGDNRPAANAQLNLYAGSGVYVDSNGVLYVGDLYNYRLRKIDLQGIITTIVGTGTMGTSGGNGAGTSINIAYPRYIAGDTMGSYLYFIDNYYVWKYQTSNGILTRYAGVVPFSQGFSGDGQQATAARFFITFGISLSTLGLLYISDYGNNRVRVVAVNGIVTTFAGSGPDGPAVGSYGGDGGSAIATNCKLYGPSGIYADMVGNVFIVDRSNNRVRKVNSFGLITTFAGGGTGGDGGPATSASLTNGYDVKGDRSGNIYITSACTVRMVNTAGIISTIIGTGTCGTTLTFSAATSSSISFVCGLWVNSDFDVYITESAGLVRKTVNLVPTSQPSSHPSSSYNVEHQNLFLEVVAGNGTKGFNGDNRPAITAQVNLNEGGVYEDSSGVLYIGDLSNHRLRKIDLFGIITTIAGTGTGGSSGASAAGTSINIGFPKHTAGDTMGTYLYFSDHYFVWKYQISNGILSRYVGVTPLSQGFSGDGQQATAAQFFVPEGISLSTLGLLYISDYGNNRVRVVAVNGILSTFAGSGPDGPAVGSYGGDGGLAVSTSCKLFHPYGVYADTIGNVFIADLDNARVRKVDSFGIIRTFAGGGSGGDGNKGTSASLSSVYDVKGDRLGNIYITSGCRIRMVNTAGIINTVIGTGACAPTLTFSAATSSTLSSVYALWVNSDFNVYFTESAGLIHKTVSVPFPTSQPSRCPSSRPSSQPLSIPSAQPFSQPTAQPSAQPTAQPSMQPSRQPSSQPSARPSAQPVSGPSSQPTDRPSALPSRQPSRQPTSQPSGQPSTQPSRQPTSQPSGQPSTQPSRQPTSQPGGQPSTQPSRQPTSQPSGLPSTQPSRQPCAEPSAPPFSQPSSQPSARPTSLPNAQPSAQPTARPSVHPAAQPSRQPAGLPSALPSAQPVSQPTSRPTARPSPQFSSEPTALPSCQPSSRPSGQPSNRPSVGPSDVPSCQPASHPSAQPSSRPSALPSTQPSCQPVSRPSGQPSSRPTAGPLAEPSCQPDSRRSGQPASLPSAAPSAQYSCQPDSYPSALPSKSPSAGPLTEPSCQPDSRPSGQPSSRPTAGPSTQPSCQPVSPPSGQPSSRPTAGPLAEPSCPPDTRPSGQPSSLPSVAPSAQYSCQPDSSPSALPSKSPSAGPSEVPSCQPASHPSAQPSSRPSALPSTQPSCQPLSRPSGQPSSRLTAGPLTEPSCQPDSRRSGQPSSLPSAAPSAQYSCQPDSYPSALPSKSPSAGPSEVPSCQPASHPSAQPSSRPSALPSTQPSRSSDQPSIFHSAVPSTQPSCQPDSRRSGQPSSLPSAGLTAQLSYQPTSCPSNVPSFQPSSLPSVHPSSFPTPGVKPPVVNDAGVPSLSILPVSSTMSRFSQMNFLLGSGVSTSDPFRDILLSGSPLLTAKSYLLLGTKSSFPSIFDLSLPSLLPLVPTGDGGLSVDSSAMRAIAFGGDFNHDHLPELIIGSPLSSKVYIIYSSRRNMEWSNVTDYSVLTGKKETSNGLGWAVSSAGDFNKDGVEDMLVSAIYSNKVFLLKGKSFLNIGQSSNVEEYLTNEAYGWTFSIRKDSSILTFGVSVSYIKDYNGDSYDDLVISALGNNGANRIYIVLGGSSFSSAISPSTSTILVNDLSFSRVVTILAPTFSFAGLSLSGVGDVNGDGLGDLLIGSIPFRKGYSTQQSYLIYGSKSSSKHIFLSNFTLERKGSIIKGGGFFVNGIGDINSDGYDDMMITSYSEWQGKVGSYLFVFPNKQQWISNIPSFLPSSSPSSASPTSTPSNRLLPVHLPSSFPSFLSFSPSSSPSFKNISTSSRSPTFVRSSRPSKSPTFSPTVFPTIISTSNPSPVPSVFPTRTLLPSAVPSFSSTTLPPTRKPSCKPSSSPRPTVLPTSYPSLSASSQGRSVPITSGGSYEGGDGEESLLISSTKDVIIKGNQGKKHFIFFASIVDNVTITILDFKTEEGDVLDFSQLTTTNSFIYSYSTNPLMFLVSSPINIRIILSSHSDYDLQAKNLILPSSVSSSSSSTSAPSLYTSAHSLMVISVVVPLLALFIFLAFLLNSHGSHVNRKQREKDHSSEFDQPKEEFDDNLSVTISDDIEGISINDSFGDSFFGDEFSDDDDDNTVHSIVKNADFRYEDMYDDPREVDSDDLSCNLSSDDDLGSDDENSNTEDDEPR
jgi:hypothetical protein